MHRRDLLKAAAAAPLLAQPALLGPRAASAETRWDDGTVVRPPVPLAKRMEGAILPDNRILSYYGFPGNELMGILGEYDPDDLLDRLREQAGAYEAADPSRPVKLAFEMMGSVAQSGAMADDSYLAYTPTDIVRDYVRFSRENDLLLILDMQYGRRSTAQEIDAILPWLEEAHVHIALDPEFAVKDGEIPGQDLGSIDSADIRYAQETLAAFAEERSLPPKILLVHQFNPYSISNKEQIAPVDGVQFLLEIDGFGNPNDKLATYNLLAENPAQYLGFKLWYQQDDPLMSPEDVLALSPSPDIVIYQ